VKGSSSRRYCGSVTSARVISRRRRSPPEERVSRIGRQRRQPELGEELTRALSSLAARQLERLEDRQEISSRVSLRKTDDSCGR